MNFIYALLTAVGIPPISRVALSMLVVVPAYG